MSLISLPEFDHAASGHRLHVIIRLPVELLPEFSQRLRRRWPDLLLREERADSLLLAIFPTETDVDSLLAEFGEIVEGYADLPASRRPELLEARLAAPAGAVPPLHFSRHLRLAAAPDGLRDGEPGLWLVHGTSFGSGRHPSTRLAMRGLDRLFEEEKPFPYRVLDVGCGSGILALVAARFGAGEVLGVDIDLEALAQATANAARNGLANRTVFTARSLSELTGSYDLVTANLTGAVLSGMLADFARLVRHPGGRLLLSGLLGRQLEEMTASLLPLGFLVLETFREERWRAALFELG